MGSYHVVTKNTMLDLEIAVSKKMKDGWECTGGLTVHAGRSAWRNYSQPMVKYDQSKLEEQCPIADHVHTGKPMRAETTYMVVDPLTINMVDYNSTKRKENNYV